MYAPVAKANILDLRGAAVLLKPKMAVAAVNHTFVARSNKPQKSKRFKLFLHPVSFGILGGLLAVISIGVFVPMLPAKAISSVDQAVPIKPPVSSNAPVIASPKNPAIAKPTDRLSINRIGTDAPVIQIGLTGAGAIDTPKTLWQVGHYSGSAIVGANSSAVIVGHSGAPGQVGVFEHIDRILVGDIIQYTKADGSAISFRVTSSKAYQVNDETAHSLVASTSNPSLNLISCYGHWDKSTQEYDQRWIVKAAKID